MCSGLREAYLKCEKRVLIKINVIMNHMHFTVVYILFVLYGLFVDSMYFSFQNIHVHSMNQIMINISKRLTSTSRVFKTLFVCHS